ncbi:MAG: hypothetical protein V2G42_05920 [bacterium JZ-2024 1]
MLDLPEQVRRVLDTVKDCDPRLASLWKGRYRVSTLTAGGSDRIFYRICPADTKVFSTRSFVVLCDPDRDRLSHYLSARDLLVRIGLYPPALITAIADSGIAVLEDVGSNSLFFLESVGRISKYKAYISAILALTVMAQVPHEQFSADPIVGNRRFDVNALRDETRYFSREILMRWLGWSSEQVAELHSEFDALAQEVANGPYGLMHRDYQSQNLHWRFAPRSRHANAAPSETTSLLQRLAILDFQNLTWGPALYDLVSLVRDPYISLHSGRQDLLVARFRDALPAHHPLKALDFRHFRRLYHATALQRHLQACAAFVHLSRVKGKKIFSGFLVPGLRLALEDTWCLANFPRLQSVLESALNFGVPD